jgi:carbon starvation protein CstA
MAQKKSREEARVERVTWGLLVLIFALLYIASDSILQALPNWLVPMAGGVVLLGSGLYQYSRRWHVSPVTWITGVILIVLAILGFYVAPNRSFIIESLLVTLIVIVFGTFTGET